MTQTHKIHTTIAHQLEQLAEIYRQNQASELMSRTLGKLLQYEADACQKELRQLREDLMSYEDMYGITSSQFYEKFQQGQTDDRMDYVEWASLFQMSKRLQTRFDLLQIGAANDDF